MTETERRILANQYRILALLKKDEEAEYSARAEALESGYEFHFDDEWFTKDEDILPAADCKQVLSILSMYEDLLFSFRKLTNKQGIDEHDVAFPGFDGNYETKQMAYAMFFCEKFDGGRRFQDLRKAPGFDFNSHRESIPEYRAMLNEHRAVREGKRQVGEYEPLTCDEIKRILAATAR